ncbi:hypothetical protein [Beggiatoa leptomitoformis]|nr:hypothetical protein [Beggiatoa leptomitoformis]
MLPAQERIREALETQEDIAEREYLEAVIQRFFGDGISFSVIEGD